MAKTGWFAQAFKESVKKTVAEVESETSAEIVVAVRPVSGHYRHVDFAVGSVLALIVLCVFLYHPEPFEFTYLPLELVAVWILGTLMSLSFPPLERLLLSKKLTQQSVELAASAAFADCGVHKTRARTGILVLVSVFERRVAVRPDAGIPIDKLGDGYKSWQAELSAALEKKNPEQFLAALRKLGPLLKDALPRAADDVNELADDVSEAA